MGEYIRSTREVDLSSFNPALIAAMRAHIEKYELGDIESSVLMGCETVSTKQKKGLLGGKGETILLGVLLTPQWLVWATMKDNGVPAVLSAWLRDLQVQDYEKSDMYRLMPDSGLNITGLRTDPVELGSTFLGLGPEPAAEQFRVILRDALAKA